MDIIVWLAGLVIGSFLNVLIYRLPLEISLINPKRSFCTKCNTQIRWYDNIPVVSYIFLKGRCRDCKSSISLIYPFVELFSGIIAYLMYCKFGLTGQFYISIILIYTLFILSFIDLKYKAVPDYLLLILLLVSFFINDFSFYNSLLFAGGFVLLNFFITYYIQNIKSYILKDDTLKTQTALGEGDIPVVAVIGGILGIKLGVIAIFLASLFAIIPALYIGIKKDDIQTPFIPFLALGFVCCFIFDQQVLYMVNKVI